jgi:hypothetical protein
LRQRKPRQRAPAMAPVKPAAEKVRETA